tara:strand:+ start:266 stop:442 length:177 start_codon:yes stop_codon:yes gene_type:complete
VSKYRRRKMATLWVNFNFEVPFDVDDQEELHEQVMEWFRDIRPDNLPYYEVSKKAMEV